MTNAMIRKKDFRVKAAIIIQKITNEQIKKT